MGAEQATITSSRGRTLPVPRPLTPTERNWLVALAIVVGSVLLFQAIGALESLLGRDPRETRLVWNGSETSMRLLALSHFLVALLFMTTSQRMRRRGSWLWFFGLLGAGALLCEGFSRLGGMAAPLAAVLFYTYFLLHEFRDQAMFYRSNGDAPSSEEPARASRGLYLAPLLGFGVIAATFVAGAAFGIGGARRFDHAFAGMSRPLRYACGVLPFVLVLLGALAVKRSFDRAAPAGLRGWLRANRPIFFVFLGIYVVLFAGIAATGRVYGPVALHVTAWYVFSIYQNSTRPAANPAPRRLSLPWMRTTTAGFNFVHLGMAALVVLAAVVWAYGFDNAPSQTAFHLLLSREAFPYWTIMHVTVSWIPR